MDYNKELKRIDADLRIEKRERRKFLKETQNSHAGVAEWAEMMVELCDKRIAQLEKRRKPYATLLTRGVME